MSVCACMGCPHPANCYCKCPICKSLPPSPVPAEPDDVHVYFEDGCEPLVLKSAYRAQEARDYWATLYQREGLGHRKTMQERDELRAEVERLRAYVSGMARQMDATPGGSEAAKMVRDFLASEDSAQGGRGGE